MRLVSLGPIALAAMMSHGCAGPATPGADAGTSTGKDAAEKDPAGPDAAAPEGPDAGPDASAGRDASARVDAGPKVYPPVPATEFCKKLAAATCDRNLRCRIADPSLKASCEKTALAACGEKVVVAALSAGRITFDDKAAGDCVGLTTDRACHADAAPEACAKVISGKGAAGDPCYRDFECGAGGFCYRVESQCPYKCAAYVTTVGEKCSSGDKRCEPKTLHCDYNKQITCQEKGGEGGQCFWSGDCKDGFSCQNQLCTAEPKKAKQGEGCGAVSGYPQCETGLFCRGIDSGKTGCLTTGKPCAAADACCSGLCLAGKCASGSCQPKIAEGGVCSGYGQCLTPLYCNSGYSVGTCRAKRAIGDRCDNYDSCRDPLYCDTNDTSTCRTYPKVGELCEGVYRCSEGSCDFTKPYSCKALKKLGEKCSYGSQCETERCISQTVNGVTENQCVAPCEP
jgi:hypothetical protein